MVRHRASRWTVAVLALIWARPASAGAIAFTGNVSNDLSNAVKGGDVGQGQVDLIPGNPVGVAQQPEMTAAGLVNGVSMKDIRLSYDAANNGTLYVGVNFQPGAIAGNYTATDNDNNPNLGGLKSISVALTPENASGTGPASLPTVVAGVPSFKAEAAKDASGNYKGTDGFTVASFNAAAAVSGTIASGYGAPLLDSKGNLIGNLAFDPNKNQPSFEFAIKNFNALPGLNAAKNGGFYLQAFSGNGQLIVDGKDSINNVFVPFGALTNKQPQLDQPPVNVPTGTMSGNTPHTPEPTTLLGWGLVAAGAAWRARRRLGRAKRS